MSERTLARRLGEQGTSLKKERDGLRKSQAEHELGHSQLSVSDIGRRVGYADPTVFGRAFKRWTGMTPSQYRLLHSKHT